MYRTITRRWVMMPATLAFAVLTGACEPVATEPITALDMEPQMSHAASGESARGHADIGDGFERYSFTARVHRDGSVRGQFQIFTGVGTEFETRAHGEVICMRVLEDGTALLGGRITSIEPALFEGQPAGTFWSVRDNGEGGDVQDEASTMILGAPEEIAQLHCDIDLGFPMEPSARGNIQVSH